MGQAPWSWIRFKLHRLVLKKSPLWRWLSLPGGRRFQVRYLAEGRNNYVFRVRERLELLKVLRVQFYQPDEPVGGEEVRRNVELANSLAARGLAPAATWLDCGACLVEDGGRPLTPGMLPDREPLRAFFAELGDWSRGTGVVLLDYNEDNWCLEPATGRIRLVDVESAFTCPLAGVAGHELVARRLAGRFPADDQGALEAFLEVELELLWRHLSQAS